MGYLEIKHQELKDIIRMNINEVCSSYVEIGWYLNLVNARTLYTEDGYKGIGDYAANEYGISKDRCSWLMKVAEKFCKSEAPELLPEYKEFTISKLREMVYLEDAQLEDIKPEVTVKEIRQMKPKPEHSCGVATQNVAGTEQASCSHEHVSCNRNIVDCCKVNMYCCADCTDTCNGYCGWVEDNGWVRHETVEETVIENEDIVIGTEEAVIDLQKNIIKNEDIDHCRGGCEDTAINRMRLVREQLRQKKGKLKDAEEAYKDMQNHPFLAKSKLEAEAFTLLLESIMSEEDKPDLEQPELPVMKNNDQRKAFLEAYESWPVWIDNKETLERYYRYDLPDGCSIVVKVYFRKMYDWQAHKDSERWSSREIYLLKQGCYFKDRETNMTSVAEHLKDMLKKKGGKGT